MRETPEKLVWLVSLVLLFSGFAFAQRDLGTITGTVTDSTGAVVPGAIINITNDQTGETSALRTTPTGDFTRPALRPALNRHRRSRGLPAGQQEQCRGYGRRQGRRAVHYGARADLRNGLSDRPSDAGAGRNPSSVRIWTPRPSPRCRSARSARSLTSRGYRLASFQGIHRDRTRAVSPPTACADTGENNFLLNGVDNNVNVIDFLNGASFVIGPPPEAIGEMSVMTSGYNAEYGRAAGGVVNVNLKTGTNELHGGVWEVLQNNDLNANSWQNNNVGPHGQSPAEPVWRGRGRPDYQESLLHLRRLPGHPAEDPLPGFDTFPTPASSRGISRACWGRRSAPARTDIAQYQIFDPASTTDGQWPTGAHSLSRKHHPNHPVRPRRAKIAASFRRRTSR